jgi:hypothetical protein
MYAQIYTYIYIFIQMYIYIHIYVATMAISDIFLPHTGCDITIRSGDGIWGGVRVWLGSKPVAN